MHRLPRNFSHFILIALLWFLPANVLLATDYTLTTQTNGSGGVSLNPVGGHYPANSVVTATAVPSGGWYFSGWSGNESGIINPLNVLMASNIALTANFLPIPTYLLATSTNGMGSISLNPPGGSYLSNSAVTVTALPAAGWVFANWEGFTNGNANPVEIAVHSNESVTAIFAELPAIAQSPRDVTAAIGDTVNFTVQAVGTPPLYFQWWFNASKLSSATNATLTLADVQLTQAGTYSVIISNAYGVASNSALLTIMNAPSGTNVVSVATEAALQSAIQIGGVVTFGFNGTLVLTNTIEITNDVALDASDRAVVISGNHAVRLFNISPGVTFSATNLVLAYGSDVGQNGANATGVIPGAEPPQNGLPGEGGAIFDNGGSVQLTGCTLASNSVVGGMGGAPFYPIFPGSGIAGNGQGGAIFVNGGSLQLDSVNLIGNSAAGGPANLETSPAPSSQGGDGLGGAIYVTNGSVLFANCDVTSNICTAPAGTIEASAFGGAVFLASGFATFSNTVVSSNAAVGGDVPESLLAVFIFSGAAFGGAIAATSGTVTITLCQITSNMAQGGQAQVQRLNLSGGGQAQGGAVFSSATFLASNSTFSGNQALSGSSTVTSDGCGGGFYNAASAIIGGCTFSSNIALGGNVNGGNGIGTGNGMGAGIFNISQLTMTNCTIALNSALGDSVNENARGEPDGEPGSGLGGGIYNSNGIFIAMNVTIASNSAVGGRVGEGYDADGGIGAGANIANSNGTLFLKNSIVAYPGTSSNASGTITDGGYNMCSDGSSDFASDTSFNFTDPQLMPLANYGGPTLTMALSSNSPAVGSGTSAGAPGVDQRGLVRPSGLNVDMGAYQLQQTGSPIPPTDYTLTTQTNGSGGVSLNPVGGIYPTNSVVTATAVPSGGWYFSGWSGNESGIINPLNVLMASNIALTANFLPIPTYLLAASTNGMGSISLNPPGGSYLSNSAVTVTALPAAGWVFANWEGFTNGNANPVEIAVHSNESVTAIFAELPAIAQSPRDVTAAIGDTVNFTVQAVGTPPLYFQWWFNASKLSSATNATLTLADVQLTQAGTYSVIISNAYGVTSNSALLTIMNAPSGTNVVSVATEAALQSAIQIGGVVTFGFNGTLVLTNTIEITNDVALDASDRAVVISGNHAVRLFNISPGVTFSATNLVLAYGSDVGQNGTNTGVEPAQNGLPGEGGAILDNGGTVQLSGCTLASNSVIGGLGATVANGIAGNGQGGAIFVNGGSLLLDSVNLSGNSAMGGAANLAPPSSLGGDGLGGAIYITNGSALFANCDLTSNFCTAPAGLTGASAFGGAFFLASGLATFSNTLVFSNAAVGGNTPGDLTEEYNTPGAAFGGAIAAASGTVTITLCQITSNLAQGGEAFRYSGTGQAEGGGVFSTATVLASNSAFSGNQALSGGGSSVNTDGCGGGFYNAGSATIGGCTFSSNGAVGGSAGGFGSPFVDYPGGNGRGGGIFNISQLIMTNCTVALNLAQGGAGGDPDGMPGSGLGGGIYNSNGIFMAMNVTIASNSVTPGNGYLYQGIGAGANIANSNGALFLKNSIVAYPGTSSNASGTITDGGYNMCSDGSADFESGSSFNFTDPQLMPLANYGGPTLTMALSSNSPAVDSGTSAGAPGADQRASVRPSGPGVDMGAYELQQNAFQIPPLTLTLVQQVLQLSFQGQANSSYSLQRSTTLTNWTELELIGPLTNNAQVNLSIEEDGQSNAFFRLFLPP